MAVDAAIGGVQDRGAPPRASDRNIGEAAFLLQRREPALVERALGGEQPFLPARKEHGIEFQPLGGMDRHDRHLRLIGGGVIVHHQANMFEERAQRFVFLHRAYEFGQIFEPARRLSAFVRLEHRGVAAFVEDLPREIGMRQIERTPTRDISHEIAERTPRLRGQLIGIEDSRRRDGQRHALRAGELVNLGHRLVAKPALGRVDDAFEGEIVRGLMNDAQIGERIADFGALVKAESANDPVGQADRDEPVFELAGLMLRANQDRDLVQAGAASLPRLDLLADAPRFFRAVPHAQHAHLLAGVELCPQRLAQSPAVLRDDAGCRAQDMRGGSIILFEPNDSCAGEVFFELQDILHLRTAPRIDRLIVVADARDVLALLREQPQPEILDGVGILILVDHDVFEAALIVRQHVAVSLQDDEHVKQQVAEIARVQRFQSILILLVEFAAAAVRIAFGFPGVDIGGGKPLVLPLIDQPRQAARRKALFVDVRCDDQLLEQAELIVGIEDGEVAVQPHQLGMATQHLRADRVEGAEPRHPLDDVAHHLAHAVPHLARGLVGEGDGQNLRWPRFARKQQMREPRGQRRRLARTGAGDDQHRPLGRQHRLPLRRIEPAQIGRIVGRRRGKTHR